MSVSLELVAPTSTRLLNIIVIRDNQHHHQQNYHCGPPALIYYTLVDLTDLSSYLNDVKSQYVISSVVQLGDVRWQSEMNIDKYISIVRFILTTRSSGTA